MWLFERRRNEAPLETTNLGTSPPDLTVSWPVNVPPELGTKLVSTNFLVTTSLLALAINAVPVSCLALTPPSAVTRNATDLSLGRPSALEEDILARVL